jgi:hypothetical protein
LLPLGRRADDVAVYEDVVAFDKAPAGEEAAGVDLGDRNWTESGSSPVIS